MRTSYQAEVLGTAPRLAVEAAGIFGWAKYVGTKAKVIGLNGLGTSAPAERLYQEFGITHKAIIARVNALIRK